MASPMILTDFEKYRMALTAALDQNEPHKKHRRGQIHFTVLYRLHPDLADAIRGGKNDPFHQDVRITAFLALVEQELKGPGSTP